MKKIFSVLFFLVCIQLIGIKVAAQCGTEVKDVDGNVYHTVKIGKQCWLQENLKTTHFRDGSAIAEMQSSELWGSTEKSHAPAWCYYQKNDTNNRMFGKLYNWYTVADPRNICPGGWHVPSEEEYQALSDFMGGDSISSAHLRSTKVWRYPSKADNSSGFTALPGELRTSFGDFVPNRGFDDDGYYGVFWSSTPSGSLDAKFLGLYFSYLNAYISIFNKGNGMSVRCIAD